MTLQEAKSIVRHLGLTLRKVRSGSYRVNFHNENEGTAYYTDNLDEAVHTAAAMARARGLVQAIAQALDRRMAHLTRGRNCATFLPYAGVLAHMARAVAAAE